MVEAGSKRLFKGIKYTNTAGNSLVPLLPVKLQTFFFHHIYISSTHPPSFFFYFFLETLVQMVLTTIIGYFLILAPILRFYYQSLPFCIRKVFILLPVTTTQERERDGLSLEVIVIMR